MILAYISYICTLLNIIAIYIGLSSHSPFELIGPPTNVPTISATVYDATTITTTIVPTFSTCEPSIDPVTIKESIFQVFQPDSTCLSGTKTSVAPTSLVPTVCEPSVDPVTVIESIFQVFRPNSTCLTTPKISFIPTKTSTLITEPLYLRKFIMAQSFDGSGITQFDTVIINYLKEDEAAVHRTLQRSVMMVARNIKAPPPRPTALLGKFMLAVWINFLRIFKLIYWSMFYYESYTVWKKFVINI